MRPLYTAAVTSSSASVGSNGAADNPGGNHHMRDGTGLTAVDTARRKQAHRRAPLFPPAPPPPAAACHHQKRW